MAEIFKYKEPADLEGLLTKLDIKDEIKERKRVSFVPFSCLKISLEKRESD